MISVSNKHAKSGQRNQEGIAISQSVAVTKFARVLESCAGLAVFLALEFRGLPATDRTEAMRLSYIFSGLAVSEPQREGDENEIGMAAVHLPLLFLPCQSCLSCPTDRLLVGGSYAVK